MYEYEQSDNLNKYNRKWNDMVVQDNWKNRKCLHDGCDKCHGSGRDKDGRLCVHMISCPCKRCNPYTL